MSCCRRSSPLLKNNRAGHRLPRIAVAPNTLVLLLFIGLADRSLLLLIPAAAALCHETGHIIVMLALGIEVRRVEITLFGAEIRSLPYPKPGLVGQAAVYFGGAAANLLTGTLALLCRSGFFAACSFALAAVNLLPIRTLDGGQILEVLLIRLCPGRADRIMDITSLIFIMLLWLASAYIILLCQGNLSLLLFSAYMFVTLFLSR